MKRTAYIFTCLLLLCFCTSSLWAEVYTIDFNRGTVNGMNIKNQVKSTTNPWLYCMSGADFVTLHSNTSKCFYNDKGCGIRIGTNDGEGWFVMTLGEAAVQVSKIVIYASKTSGYNASQLTITGGQVFTHTISNDELQDYSTSTPASEHYVLPEIVIDKSFINLTLKTSKQGYVMLHRIDIYIGDGTSDDDAVNSPLATSPSESKEIYNLVGQRISTSSRGLSIIIKGGRKYVVK